MARAIDMAWPTTDALIMAAAVADFRPAAPEPKKIKKRVLAAPTIELLPTLDILRVAAARPDRGRVTLVGFAAETDDVIAYARAKLAEKDLDAIVANDVSKPGVGFGPGDNAGWLLTRGADELVLPRAPKEDFAEGLAAALVPILRARRGPR